ncbi:MAG: hypothetical protein AAGE94_08120 [Acidobacteriota bacterium]
MNLHLDPGTIQVLLVLLFVVIARSESLHTRTGGVILAAAVVTGLAGMALDPVLGSRLADPTRLPAAIFALSALSVSWWALRRESLRRRTGVLRAPRVGRSTDVVGVLGVAIVVVLAVVWPAPRIGDALPAPWFLIGLRELTVVFTPIVAFGLLPLILVLALVAAPWLDTRDPDDVESRRDEVPFFLFAWAAVGWAPMVAGVFWRQAPPALAPSLSSRLFVDLLAVPEPSWLLLRELPGLLLIGLLFVVLPRWLATWRASRGVFDRHLRRLGAWRYQVVMAVGVLVAWVPIKVACQVAFGIGPWIALPEWGIVL